jgi:HK97 family phage major capsid protein
VTIVMSDKKIGDYISYSPFTKLLQAAFGDNSVLDTPSAKTLLTPEIGEDKYKALLQSNALQESNLLQEEVFKTISEGAEPYKCMREILPIIKTDSYSVRIVKGETGSYAEEVAEGSKVPIDTQVYTKEDITINKIGTRPLITNELIEDSLFDIVELELKKAGARMENKLNRDCILEVLTDLGVTNVDPDGSHVAVTDLAKARADIESANYMPDVMITHPSAEGYLLQDSNLVYASYAGSPSNLNTGKLPTILGMKPYTLSVTTGSTDKYWDSTDGANHYNVVLLDSKASTYLGMRRDLTVEEYDDPIHDILGIACTMRYGVATIQANAGVGILTK